jgi:hypothetical protein
LFVNAECSGEVACHFEGPERQPARVPLDDLRKRRVEPDAISELRPREGVCLSELLEEYVQRLRPLPTPPSFHLRQLLQSIAKKPTTQRVTWAGTTLNHSSG